MYREQLTPYPASQQLSFESLEERSAIEEKSQMGFGIWSRKMDHPTWDITNVKLLHHLRFIEMLDMLFEIPKEFPDPYELIRLFQQKGICTRTGNIYEMYLEMEELLCNYCIQVNLEDNAPYFIKISAFAKDLPAASIKAKWLLRKKAEKTNKNLI